MQSTPHNSQSINSQHSLPDPNPKPTHMKAAKRTGQQQVAPIPFLNADPIAHLIGFSNEAHHYRWAGSPCLDRYGGSGVEHKCSVLQRAHLTNPAPGSVIGARGTGSAAIPYLRFVEVNLQIPWIRSYNEDVLLLVIPTMTYSKTALVIVGTKINNPALSFMTAGDLAKATTTWRQAHFGAVMLGSLQLSCSSSDKSKVTTGATGSSQQGDTLEVQKFQLNDVKGLVWTTQKVTIPPFSTVNIQANTSVKGHCM